MACFGAKKRTKKTRILFYKIITRMKTAAAGGAAGKCIKIAWYRYSYIIMITCILIREIINWRTVSASAWRPKIKCTLLLQSCCCFCCCCRAAFLFLDETVSRFFIRTAQHQGKERRRKKAGRGRMLWLNLVTVIFRISCMGPHPIAQGIQSVVVIVPCWYYQ